MAKISSLKSLYVHTQRIPKPTARDAVSPDVWLERERKRARSHLLDTLERSRSLATTNHGDPERALELLEAWLLDDELGLEFERQMLFKLDAAHTALAALLKELRGERLPGDALMANWKQAIEEGRALPRDVMRFIARLVTRWHYQVSIEEYQDLEDAAFVVESLLDRIGVVPPPHVHRVVSSTQETPVLERFARQCLGYGLGPREAAMIEAIVQTRAGKASTPALWFDAPTAAEKRWRQAYERIAAKADAWLTDHSE